MKQKKLIIITVCFSLLSTSVFGASYNFKVREGFESTAERESAIIQHNASETSNAETAHFGNADNAKMTQQDESYVGNSNRAQFTRQEETANYGNADNARLTHQAETEFMGEQNNAWLTRAAEQSPEKNSKYTEMAEKTASEK